MPLELRYFLQEYGSNPFEAFWFIFGHGGVLILIPIMIRLAIKGWVFWIQEKYKHHVPHVMYKVEVPQNNEQSMKAIEQIFVQLYGTHNPPDWWEKWWQGYVQEEFALEIVSDGGYITFYVRTPTYFKEIVQAAFYAHYPDAILTEAEDYTKEINVDMINDGKVKVWGSEMKLEGDDVKPIKPYPGFEHQIAQKAVDPIANMLEFLSRMQPGEKLWYQILIQPTDLNHFKERAQVAIDEIVEPGGAGHAGPDIVDHIQKFVMNILELVHKLLFGGEDAAPEAHSDRLAERQRLTTPEREFVEEVDRKASRWPFHTKVRFMYFAPPNIWDGKKARRGMLGALKLYRFVNAFAEGALTRTDWGTLPYRYVFPQPRLLARARKMFWAYRSRDMERGEHEGFVLSTEEITAIFHFPSIDVRAPFVAKAQSRGVEPPTLLRYDDSGGVDAGPPVQMESGNPVALDPRSRVSLAPDQVVPEQVAGMLPSQPGAAMEPNPGSPTGSSNVTNDPDLIGPQPPSNLPFV